MACGSECTRTGSSKLSATNMSLMDSQLWRGGETGVKGVSGYFRCFGPKWGRILAAYFELVPKEARPQCARVLLRRQKAVVASYCETCWIDRLKEVSVAATRTSITLGPGWWSYLCDIHVLGGYDTPLNRVDVLQGYEHVVGRQGAGTDNARLRHFVDETVSRLKVRNPHEQIPFSKFIEFRDTWGLMGAATMGRPAEVYVKGKRQRVRGKFPSLLCMSDAEIITAARAARPALIYPFRKPDEPVKTRVVQSYDTCSYLRCSYADWMIADYNGAGAGAWTTLGMTQEHRAWWRFNLSTRLRSGEFVAVSLDQSHFDESQRKSLVRYALAAIWDRVITSARADLVPELTYLRDVELFSFDHAEVRVKSSSGERLLCSWEQGVPSGHKWTGLIDSVLNRAETLWVSEFLGYKLDVGLWQGDDAIVLAQKGGTASDWARGYAALGLEVNEHKTWVSSTRFEFLHELHGEEGAWGMPVRAARSILWKKPLVGSSGFSAPHVALAEHWADLLRAQRRGLRCWGIALRSVTRAFARSGISRPAVKAAAWLQTPSALGGGGWGSSGRLAGEWEAGKLRWQKVELRSPVRMSGGSERCRYRCAIRRLGFAAPLPFSPARFVLWRVAPISRTPPGLARVVKRLPKTAWEAADYNRGIPAWDRKIRLEDALNGHGRVTPDLCPSHFVLKSPIGVDRAILSLSFFFECTTGV